MSKYAEIDSIHHVEMKHHRYLMSVEKKLDSIRLTLESRAGSLMNAAQIRTLTDSASSAVQSAIQKMNVVMPDLGQPDYEALSHEQVTAILDRQMASLDTVSQRIRQAIDLSATALKTADSLLRVPTGKQR
ncbi:MAG: hypothetical protein HUU10_04970 [Bacteroidetes bacterium]|nr:hypothetical protein [Bacteroidota bacterium]